LPSVPSLPSPPTSAGLVRPASHRLQEPPTSTSEEDPEDPGAESPESPFPVPGESDPGLSPAFDQIDVDPLAEDVSMIEDLNDLPSSIPSYLVNVIPELREVKPGHWAACLLA
jgi:hypothetical protein